MKAYTHVNEHDWLEIAYIKDEADLRDFEDPKRAEWADEYAPNDPPASAWMDNGYTHGCSWCEHRLSASDDYCDSCASDAPDDDAADAIAEGGIVFNGHGVYCSQRCLDAETEERERHRTAKEAAKAELLAKYPFVAVTRAWIGGPGQCQCFRTNSDNACVHFTFEGSKLGDYSNVYCSGCKRAWICNGDLAAFKKAKGGA